MTPDELNPNADTGELCGATVLPFEEVRRLLPHAFPFLMVDRVIASDPPKEIRTLKNISGSDLLLIGHFPACPIFPGTLLIEGLAQSALLLRKLSGGEDPKGTLYLLGAVRARFMHPVYVGDQVQFTIRAERSSSSAATFSGHASVSGQRVAAAEITVVIRRGPVSAEAAEDNA